MSAPAIIMPGSVELGTEPQTQQQQDITNLAYALWQQRGCPEGSSEQDWVEAERKLKLRDEEPATLTHR